MVERSGSRGFTLIELLATIALMGVLLSAAVGLFITFESRKQLELLERDLRDLTRILLHYYISKEAFPSFSGGAVPSELRAEVANLKNLILWEVIPQGDGGALVKVLVPKTASRALEAVEVGSMILSGWRVVNGNSLVGRIFPISTAGLSRSEMNVGKRYSEDQVYYRGYLVDPEKRVYQ